MCRGAILAAHALAVLSGGCMEHVGPALKLKVVCACPLRGSPGLAREACELLANCQDRTSDLQIFSLTLSQLS